MKEHKQKVYYERGMLELREKAYELINMLRNVVVAIQRV